MANLPVARLTHVGIYVHNLERMQAFYRRLFGLHLSDRGEMEVEGGHREFAFLTGDPMMHHQLVMVSGRPPDVPFNVLNQLSFLLGSLADLRAYYEALAAEPEVTRIQPLTHGNAWSVYFRDPEGNRLELYADTPWYVTQPLRGPLDFSRSDEEIVAATREFVFSFPSAEEVGAQRRRVAAALGAGGRAR